MTRTTYKEPKPNRCRHRRVHRPIVTLGRALGDIVWCRDCKRIVKVRYVR